MSSFIWKYPNQFPGETDIDHQTQHSNFVCLSVCPSHTHSIGAIFFLFIRSFGKKWNLIFCIISDLCIALGIGLVHIPFVVVNEWSHHHHHHQFWWWKGKSNLQFSSAFYMSNWLCRWFFPLFRVSWFISDVYTLYSILSLFVNGQMDDISANNKTESNLFSLVSLDWLIDWCHSKVSETTTCDFVDVEYSGKNQRRQSKQDTYFMFGARRAKFGFWKFSNFFYCRNNQMIMIWYIVWELEIENGAIKQSPNQW